MPRESCCKFTEIDRKILASYKELTEGLSDFLGPSFEIVLHSLEDKNESVIAIKHAEFSGRSIGSPVTDLAFSMLHEIESGQNHQDYLSYFNQNGFHDPMKSVTIVIRGEENKAIGLLCINWHYNMPFQDFINMFIPSDKTSRVEHYTNDSDEMLLHLISNATASVDARPDVLPSTRNKMIINTLAAMGAFNIKSAIELTAQALGISKNTVYLHLRNYQKETE